MADISSLVSNGVNTATPDPSGAGSGMPVYSWGYDPTTQNWGYFVKNAGENGNKIGVKTGSKYASYKADPHDAASTAQEALNHLMDTQTTANPAAVAAAATPATTAIANSGISSALGRDVGHGSGSQGSGASGSSDGSSGLGGLAAGLGNLGQTLGENSMVGKALMGISNTIAANNNPNYSNEGYNKDAAPTSPNIGTVGNPTGPTAPAEGNTNSPMGTDPAQAAANRAAADAAANNANGGPVGPDGTGGWGGEARQAHDGTSAGSGGGGDGRATGGHDSGDGSHDASGGGDRGTRGGFAEGGPVGGLGAAAGLPPRFIRGPGDGQSDSVPVKMDDGADGRLADNEFVVPADAVSALGSGSSEAGARALYDFVDRVRQMAHGHTKQANPVDPGKVLPA
jgi:hypothetical protein